MTWLQHEMRKQQLPEMLMHFSHLTESSYTQQPKTALPAEPGAGCCDRTYRLLLMLPTGLRPTHLEDGSVDLVHALNVKAVAGHGAAAVRAPWPLGEVWLCQR